jgi:hypothetical protein
MMALEVLRFVPASMIIAGLKIMKTEESFLIICAC